MRAGTLVHHCFDWMLGSPIEIPDGSGTALAVVNPNARCSCSKRIGSEERNQLLREQKACVILIPGTQHGDFRQIVEKIEHQVPTARVVTGSIVERAYVNGEEDAVASIEAHGEFFNCCLMDLGADERPRQRVSPPVHVLEPQPDDGAVLYIRVDEIPEFTKPERGCGRVVIPEYVACRCCGQRVSVGKDQLAYATIYPDKTIRVYCPFCGKRDGYVLPFTASRNEAYVRA